jgi:phosphate starvation-inducible PhoH-like protein
MTTKKNTFRFKPVSAKTENQKKYINYIHNKSVIFCTGPSGTGKSFIASGLASEFLLQEKIYKVIATRPLVCTGKDIGSLPGELENKIAPYLQPLEDNLKFFLKDLYHDYIHNGFIEFKPLETMRGSTFDNAFIILDEAQNCTVSQIKMLLTRIGSGSKIIVNGDTDQNDLRGASGLEYCIKKLAHIEEIGHIDFNYDDIQRNDLIGKILRAGL